MTSRRVESLLVDLDDTLYDEFDYVRSGMGAVAADIAGRTGHSVDAVRADLLDLLTTTGREKILDRTLRRFGLAATKPLIAELVEVYRSHPPCLTLYPGVVEMLQRLRACYRIAIVTDGMPRMQHAKISALGLEALVDAVIYTWELGYPKPAPGGYVSAADALGATPLQSLVVGDNPDHDIRAAAAAGMPVLRVRSGRFADRPNPAPVCANLSQVTELEAWLAAASEF